MAIKFTKHAIEKVKVTYDSEGDVLSWELSPRAKIDYASEMGNIIVHFTKKNAPVLVEVLEASQFIRKNAQAIATVRSFALR